MLTTRFLFLKFFPKKFGQKIGGGSSNGGFRERHVCGSGPAPPRPPFVQMKNTRGSFFRRHSSSVPSGARQSCSVRNHEFQSPEDPRAGQPSCHISATLEDAIARGDPYCAWSCAGGPSPRGVSAAIRESCGFRVRNPASAGPFLVHTLGTIPRFRVCFGAEEQVRKNTGEL